MQRTQEKHISEIIDRLAHLSTTNTEDYSIKSHRACGIFLSELDSLNRFCSKVYTKQHTLYAAFSSPYAKAEVFRRRADFIRLINKKMDEEFINAIFLI